jgi:chloramphenicol 3-O phosphotransferase
MDKGPTLIFLDGAPSAGKTTIATALQEILAPPYAYVSIDHFLRMLPNKGFCKDGLVLVQSIDSSGSTCLEVEWGETIDKLLLGYVEALLGMAAVGNSIITDVILSRPEDIRVLAKTFQFLRAYLIQIYAPLEVLEKREKRRNEPQGLARGRFEQVYAKRKSYDLRIDTSIATPEQAAQKIKTFISHHDPKAWRELANTIEGLDESLPVNQV